MMFLASRIGIMINRWLHPWDVSNATYANKNKSVTAQETSSYGLAFSADGTKMYVPGFGSRTIFQYTLSTAWDVSTATYANKSKSVTAQLTVYLTGLAFSADGTKMYAVSSANGTVYQYTLSTAWDVSTAAYASKNKSLTAQDAAPYNLAFSADGTKMYVVGVTNDTVYQYTLSTAWDVSTASYASKNKSVNAQEANPNTPAFSADGTTMYVVGTGNDTVYQYTLSTAWDVSTASYASKSAAVGAQETYPRGLAFSADGTTMYILGHGYNTVFQYTLE